MIWTYRCTKCGSVVNPGGRMVVLVAVRGGAQMLIGFHPEPGNYEIYAPPEADLEHGDKWSFHCPVCRSDLVSDLNENLCELDFEEHGERKRLLFSRICGEHATYVIFGDGDTVGHGEQRDVYDDTVKVRLRGR